MNDIKDRCQESRKRNRKVAFGLGGGYHSKRRKTIHLNRPIPERNTEIKTETKYEFFSSGKKDELKFRVLKQPSLEGNRILDLQNLREHITDLSLHSALCPMAITLAQKGEAPITLVSEESVDGLASVLSSRCNGCGEIIKFDTSPIVKTNDSTFTYQREINVRAVWGTIASGGGDAKLRQQTGTLNMNGISSKMFSTIEENINTWWNQTLQEEMEKAGIEEKKIAVSKGI